MTADAPASSSRQIWIIDEGSPGHLSQSRGLAKAIAQRQPSEITEIPVKSKVRGIFRPALRAWLNSGRALSPTLEKQCYDIPETLPEQPPDLLIASGGKSVPYAVSTARRRQCPLIYCGAVEPFPPAWFFGILSPVPLAAHARVIQTEALVTPMSASTVAAPASELRKTLPLAAADAPLAAMLIGGSSRSHRYEDTDWQALIAGMNALHSQHGLRWLVTTSRRTDVAVENQLRQGLNPEAVAYGAWWHQQPEKVVAAFLGAADYLFVTQDSLTMMSEAVAVGKPVFLLAPETVRHSDLLEGVIGTVADRRRLLRTPIAQLTDLSLDPAQWQPVQRPPIDGYTDTVIDWLSW